jgi:hypothetical protein
MAEINFESERERFKKCYKKWKFVRRIVDLYAEGVSWEGCKIIALTEPDKIPLQYSQIIDADAIKGGVRGMLVDGTGDFNLKVLDSVHVLSIPVLKEAPIEEAQLGRSFLWRATINADALETMLSALGTSPNATQAAEMVKFLEDDMCRGLGVPRWLLQPIVATADADGIMNGLTTFIWRVEQLRKHIAFHMTELVRPLISKGLTYDGWIKVEWNESWYQSGFLRGYGPVYQVFKAQGIELRTLAEQVLNTAKSALDNSFISRQTYEESVKWFR